MSRPKSALTQRVELLADYLGLSPETVRKWHTYGCNLFSPDGENGWIAWWRRAQMRRRNRTPQRTRYGWPRVRA